MIRRNIRVIIVFLLSCGACVLLSYFTSTSCDAILNYSWTVQFGVGGVIIAMIKMFIVWVTGVTVWLLIRRKIQPQRYYPIKLFYFALLPLFIFSKQLLEVPGDVMNKSLEHSICDKTVSNGMTTKSTNITPSEYDYLKTRFQLLPTLPLTAEKINISYYTDHFLGDYSLSVQFECAMNEVIDTASHKWWVESIEGSTNRKAVTYESGAD